MGQRLILISGFNNSKYVSSKEQDVIDSLSSKGFDIHRLNYYKYYKKHGSAKLVSLVAQELIDEYFKNDCEPLTIVGWSLGGCITAEVLNLISSLNEQLDEKDKIKINKIILFSPAWFITNPIKMISRKEFVSKEVKKLNKSSETKSIDYFVKNWQAFYHLLSISHFSRKQNSENDGLSIFRDFDTTCIIPGNDQYINIKKTKEKARAIGMHLIEVGNYGHLSILIPNVIDQVIADVKQKKKV